MASSNAAISEYAGNRSLVEARQLFGKMPKQNVVSWNAMIAGYAWNEQYGKALELFSQMHWAGVKPNESTFSSVLSICANLYALENE